jgi:hypothetical protein
MHARNVVATCFFDLMTHLIIHLVDGLEICGPTAARWCYLIERHLYVLKNFVRNKAKPKACMASGYMYDEALGFCMEYFALYSHTRCCIWDANEEEVDVGEVLVGSGKLKRLFTIEMECIHEHVITNAMVTEAPHRYYVNHYACLCI